MLTQLLRFPFHLFSMTLVFVKYSPSGICSHLCLHIFYQSLQKSRQQKPEYSYSNQSLFSETRKTIQYNTHSFFATFMLTQLFRFPFHLFSMTLVFVKDSPSRICSHLCSHIFINHCRKVISRSQK